MEDANRNFLSSIFTEKYYNVYNIHVMYTLNSVFSILHKLNMVNSLESDLISCEKLMEQFNFSSQAKHSIAWMLNFLKTMGYLENMQQNDMIFFKIKKRIPHNNCDYLAAQILELDNNWSTFVDLLKHITLEYGLFLKGEKTGLDILFGSENRKLWNDYFNNTFAGYEVFNIFGAYGVLNWVSNTDNGKFLELGGGTAGATIKLLDKFKEKNLMHRIEEYIFSDVSPIFLRAGYNVLTEKFLSVDQAVRKKVDFNQSFAEQKITPESIDVVYAVNALHISYDLSFSLKEIYNTLKNKGVLIISEMIRPLQGYALCQEFIFNLLDSYYNAKLDPELRPMHGFLTPEHWKRNFESAGFKNVELITNTELPQPSGANNPTFALIIKGQKLDR